MAEIASFHFCDQKSAATFPRNHSRQRAGLQQAHPSACAGKEGSCAEADVCQLRAQLQEASCPRTMCGWKGKPILLLLFAVRYKLHAGGFDDNMVLPPGASSESSTKGITSSFYFLFFFFNTLNSFTTDEALLPS